jgi:pyrroloquinoline quinone biosynthesis protein B
MRFWILNLIVFLVSFQAFGQIETTPLTKTTLVVLGTAQDAGSPQINCTKNCCRAIFEGGERRIPVVSLGVDRKSVV